ncbi:HEL122Cp [Eremothecium sinecaudum]|uniref:HEL122Cp n=1 Tax=Eremothecium sinecaudum TaxID=45286 RepID=A0A0X8HTK1_9SACH|nr:HEL122Cp [Eremothecium sinecaudum]AMD21158.1 HEL122Cp [Eremothecium sinecaudum]
MSFVKNILLGGVKTSEDPTGVTNENTENRESNSTSHKEPIVQTTFYPRTLYKFNGHDDEKIYIAIKGKVYDCSASRQFYGPSGPYSNFAGHDASRGLATNSFDIEMISSWDRPIDDLSDLSAQELEALDSWESHFERKYPCIGVLVPEPGVNI